MTYCAGILVQDGLVMIADTRTNAGLDDISTFRKLHVFNWPGERNFGLMTAGNLSITQSVVSFLHEGLPNPETGELDTLQSVSSMFRAAQFVGRCIRHVREIDGAALEDAGVKFEIGMLFGGQIKGQPMRLFMIYSAGNFIECGIDSPFLQIGEHKYGKPILDRVARPEMRLGEAAKLILLSFDSTLRSNLSVGMPIDILLYERDSLDVRREKRIFQDDEYFKNLSSAWSDALRSAFRNIDEFKI